MAPLAPAVHLPSTPANTMVLGPPQTREQVLVLEVHSLAGGIVNESQTNLCMCPGCCAGRKTGQRPLPQGSRERPLLVGPWKSLLMLVLGTTTLIRCSQC